ncbi:MAG: hypothetical protein R3246_07815 [Acidimicrobiia bacterium]|nr:hypothetical protein [Acidimicrobiia bacterium]
MTISTISGRRQGPWLRGAIRVIAALALVGVLLPEAPGDAAAGSAVVAVISVPLLRVIWIIYRLAGERDRRFVIVGVSLLSVVAFGVAMSLFLR